MGTVNKVFLIGNLGADPELNYTTSNKPVANLSVATSDVYKDKAGQRQEKTEWHRVVVWGDSAEHCQKYLQKGRQVCVEGRIQTRSWEDNDGQKKYATEIIAERVTFLGGGERREGGEGGERRERGERKPREKRLDNLKENDAEAWSDAAPTASAQPVAAPEEKAKATARGERLASDGKVAIDRGREAAAKTSDPPEGGFRAYKKSSQGEDDDLPF